MRKIKHPNVAAFEAYFVSPTRYFIVMEQCRGREMSSLLNNRKRLREKDKKNKYKYHFTARQVHNIMRDLLSAVSTIHHNNVVHRDIKMENLRFLSPRQFDYIKLLDFGCATFYEVGSKKKMYGMFGSPYYMAPEMLNNTGYDEKVDVWSCGVIFFYLLTGSFPFDGKSDIEVLHEIQTTTLNYKSKKFKYLDKETLILLQKLLSKDPKMRISATEAR